jgi:uncharacterized protein YndB with AHSA1/START domain
MTQVEIDARVAGSFLFVDKRDGEITEYTGEYIELIPHRRLVFALAMGIYADVVTRVTVDIERFKDGCELSLLHEQVPPDRADYVEGRWTGILYGLGVTLDPTSEASSHDQE